MFATPLTATGNPPNPPQICVRIPGTLKLEQVHPEFTITVEVYSMQAHEEVLPHEIKYHIAKDKKVNILYALCRTILIMVTSNRMET